jgi:hypothetical protein
MYAVKRLTSKRIIPAAISVTGLALASLGAVGGTPASAAVPTCQLTVHSNKVLNLEDRGNNDEIFFKLGQSRTPTQQYTLGQKRFNIGSETFQNSIDVRVFERDASNLTLVGTLNNIPCVNEPGELDDVSGSGGIYRVKWSVS